MSTLHIGDIDLALYASGYRHFAEGAVEAIQAHLAQCKVCSARLDQYIESVALSEAASRRTDEEAEAAGRLPEDEGGSDPASIVVAVIGGCRKWAPAAAAVLLLCGLAWAGIEVRNKRLEHRRDLQELANLRQELARVQRQYDKLWAGFGFEEIIKPLVDRLPAEPGNRPDRVHVRLSPRVKERLIQGVCVSWGDAGDMWQPVYEAEGTIKDLEAAHEYALPPAGKASSWTLRVMYAVPDAVAAARRLTPDKLTSTWRVVATADGIASVTRAAAAVTSRTTSDPPPPQITWLEPRPNGAVGWEAEVVLKAPVRTDKVTLLVRHTRGTELYIQSGARPLPAETPQSFGIQVGTAPGAQIGEEFEILVVCSDSFRPKEWSLSPDEVPYDAVISQISVRKAAGTIRVQAVGAPGAGIVRAQGNIWTSNGGALVVAEGKAYKVLRVLPPRPAGGAFDDGLKIGGAPASSIRLLVAKDQEISLKAGQVIARVPRGQYWSYAPAERTDGGEAGTSVTATQGRPVIEITSPQANAEVGSNVIVEGIVRVDDLAGRSLVVGVHPMLTDLIYIQPLPMKLEKVRDGYRFRTRAHCGTTAKGAGEKFEFVALLVKEGQLKEGDQLFSLPRGVPVSPSVLVTRVGN